MNQWKYQLTKPVIDRRELDAVARVLDSGWLAEGKETEAFEHKVAEYVGAKYAIAVTNCTQALELYLKAFRFKESIILPDFTHQATIQAILNTGNTPALQEVDLKTYNLANNPFILNGGYVIPVSWGGNPSGYTYSLIDDAACSLGAEIDNMKVGARHEACFSFHPRKLITTGEGGMITTNDRELDLTIRKLKNFGVGGGNYKFDDIRAAIGLMQMDKLEMIIEKRIRMAHIYDDLLKDTEYIKTPEVTPGTRHTYQTYAVYLKHGNRDQIIEKLKEQSIETNRGAYALHLLPQYANVQRIGDLHNSELLDAHLLALPMAYDIDEDGQKFVVSCLKQALA